MNERMSRQEISEAVDRRLSGLQGDPWLTAKVLSKAEGEKTVKKLSATAIIVIVLLVLTMAGGLAAALQAWGVIDFAGNTWRTYVPENAQESVTRENVSIETDHLVCQIRDSYYDGEILMLTAQVTPKEKVLLFAEDGLLAAEEEGGPTAADKAIQEFDGRAASVWLFPADVDDGGGDCRINDDGSVTVYTKVRYDTEMQDREVPMELGYAPCPNLKDIAGDALMDEGPGIVEEEMEQVTFNLQVHAVESENYVCEEPMDFPSAGVQVTRVEMRATPLEVSYRLYYTVTDLEKYRAMENSLQFEFVDPSSTAADYYEQTFESGVSSMGMTRRADGSEDFEPRAVGALYCQQDSLSLNAKSGEYTIRAYNAGEDTRLESATFKVTKVK